MIKGKIVAIDFDGTITKENLFPEIKELRENVVEVINKIAEHNTICIWTCRTGETLENAIESLRKVGIRYNYINQSPCDKLNPSMRKIIADYYIDDRNIFCKEINWLEIEKYFMNNDK